MKHTIIAFTENKPGVLYRIADLFLRRSINIESLFVAEVDSLKHLSRFIIDVDASPERAQLIVHQMERIVEVRRVACHENSTITA